MYHAPWRKLWRWLLDLLVGAGGLAVLARAATSGAAEVMARCVYGGDAPAGARFVEGRYGLVAVREIHDRPQRTAVGSGLGDAA